jgi:ribulose-5-phosphate 4-epimerase/fuculose-1-phosphate aldolase
VDGSDARIYLERFIHGEIYKVRPEVKAVVHNHAAAVTAFGASNNPLRPIYHMASFVGRGVPIFDIRKVAGDTDMPVKTSALCAALARTLGDKPAALTRGHGAVVVGDSLPQAVGRSYYLQKDAKLHTGNGAWRRHHLSRCRRSRQDRKFRRLRTRLGFVEEQGDGQVGQ